MKPAPFAYHDPRSIADLVDLLGRHENSKMLAGGQSLMPMLNMRFSVPDHVIDLNRIEDLNFIRETGNTITIGAMTRQRALERHVLIAQHLPVMQEALRFVGHFQTRSRGTIGGSLCHLDPAAELPGIAALYDATLQVAGPRGHRTIAFADWGAGYMTSALEPDEVLTSLTLPKSPHAHGHAFIEFSRRHGDFAMAGTGCLLALDQKSTITHAAIALIGVATAPVRLRTAEAALIGQQADPATFKAAAEHARAIECLDDAYVSATYRQHLAGVLVERALAVAAERAKGVDHVRH